MKSYEPPPQPMKFAATSKGGVRCQRSTCRCRRWLHCRGGRRHQCVRRGNGLRGRYCRVLSRRGLSLNLTKIARKPGSQEYQRAGVAEFRESHDAMAKVDPCWYGSATACSGLGVQENGGASLVREEFG